MEISREVVEEGSQRLIAGADAIGAAEQKIADLKA
jgi:hypothetical protein